MKGNDEIICALQEYIKNEQDGYTFYKLAAASTSNDSGREMFESLAGDELQHIAKLQAEYESLASGGDWLSPQQLAACSLGETAVFPQSEERVSQMIKRDASDIDALEFAIQMEKNSYSSYDMARQRTSDATASAVFAGLAAEEREHLQILENTLEYLANTGYWFQVQEKPILEG